ncbi:MAG: phosphoribosylglycinamide formyltransferase [Candidatus Dadabacteria bacterium]|nr:phosphoribosylglycinamide formyltransferase [Candidatus Dadabacteria bacterium]TDI90033.1 MAG: phosphoribosylglycinamide formyltransferase [Candidatus Dadabacteria bacterium]TDI98789.1 MAG: phosphoribosylglycinamide formyltransferase [Candidatus Dadabacteria bacterium]
MRVAVFASGSGTNLQAIIDADIQTIEIAVVFTNNPDAYAIERAKKHNIQVEIIDHKNYKTREEYEKHIIKVLGPYKLNLIVLAGFMRILSTVFVRAYKNKIVNIHPALLPSFPGINAGRRALEYGVKYTGVTVHFVDEGVDTGPIILQSVVEIKDEDTEDTLLEKIHEVEHRIYPKAIELISSGEIEVIGRRVIKKS